MESFIRITLGCIAAAIAGLLAWIAMGVIASLLALLVWALGVAAAAYVAYNWGTSSGYDKAVSASASALNFFSATKARLTAKVFA